MLLRCRFLPLAGVSLGSCLIFVGFDPDLALGAGVDGGLDSCGGCLSLAAAVAAELRVVRAISCVSVDPRETPLVIKE